MPETDFGFCCNFLDVVFGYVGTYVSIWKQTWAWCHPPVPELALGQTYLGGDRHRTDYHPKQANPQGRMTESTSVLMGNWRHASQPSEPLFCGCLSCFRIQIVELIFKNCPCTFVPILFRVCVLIFARQDVSFFVWWLWIRYSLGIYGFTADHVNYYVIFWQLMFSWTCLLCIFYDFFYGLHVCRISVIFRSFLVSAWHSSAHDDFTGYS